MDFSTEFHEWQNASREILPCGQMSLRSSLSPLEVNVLYGEPCCGGGGTETVKWWLVACEMAFAFTTSLWSDVDLADGESIADKSFSISRIVRLCCVISLLVELLAAAPPANEVTAAVALLVVNKIGNLKFSLRHTSARQSKRLIYSHVSAQAAATGCGI